MALWDMLGAMAALNAGQTAESDPYAENRKKDEAFRSALPHDAGYAPHLPEGYDLAARTASGMNQGAAAWNPAHQVYSTPDAVGTRQKARDLMGQYGFAAPEYAADVPQTLASPLTNALVNSAANPIRDRMMWQYNNPTASLEKGVSVHRGNLNDPRDFGGIADDNRQQAASDLAKWDANQAQIGLAGAQAGAEQARGRSMDAQAGTQNGQLANDTMRAEAERTRAQAAADEVGLQKQVVGQSLGGPGITPGHPPANPAQGAAMLGADTKMGGSAINSIITDAAKNHGYLSDVIQKLDQTGALNDPNVAPFVAASLRFHFGPEIDRIMGGGTEGLFASILPTSGNLMSGYGMWGSPQTSGGMAYGRSLQQARQRLAQIFPGQYKEIQAAPGPNRVPMDFSGGFGSY